jgi:hypothetical protein
LIESSSRFSFLIEHDLSENRFTLFRIMHWGLSSRRITNFSPDQVASMAQTLTSTRPSGNAMSLTTTSVRSLFTPDAFFGQEIQIMPSGAIAWR